MDGSARGRWEMNAWMGRGWTEGWGVQAGYFKAALWKMVFVSWVPVALALVDSLPSQAPSAADLDHPQIL